MGACFKRSMRPSDCQKSKFQHRGGGSAIWRSRRAQAISFTISSSAAIILLPASVSSQLPSHSQAG